MDKSPDAFRTISEVADHLDTPAHVLRFWESRFPQVRPVKRAGGRRYYRPSDVALLAGIRRLLHEEGLTIRGVQKILREQGVRHVAGLSGAEPVAGDVVEGVAAEMGPAPVAPAEAAPAEPEPAATPPLESAVAADEAEADWEDGWEDESEAAAPPAPEPSASPAPLPPGHDDLPLFAAPRSDEGAKAPQPEPPKVPLTGLRALRAAKPPVEAAATPGGAVPEAPAPASDPQETDLGPVLARLRALKPGALAPHRAAIDALAHRLEALRAAPGMPPRGPRG